jgi:asparagine synthase (glutamine-hydrolysing)
VLVTVSCIVGVINLDGAPVDRDLLQRMTGAMNLRGPDASEVWCVGNVGLGHAMLRISPESEHERQPCTLDNQVWITADARIDGRVDLLRQLRSVGQQVRSDAPDVELILHAYSAFGASFLDHLIGDFAFALWDGRHRKLVCARDHFGVRPFFYVKTENVFLFSSDILALFKHPAVSNRLDEDAVGDFLLFGNYLDSKISIYMDIRRLPAASYICLNERNFEARTYWKLNSPDEIRKMCTAEYVEQFSGVFNQAVNDRIRTKNVAAELSGGMDSTAIASMATKNFKAYGGILTTFTNTCKSILPEDQEGYYAGLAASHLGVPVVYRDMGEYALFERHESRELMTAEPAASPNVAFAYDRFAEMQRSGARVLLSGFGGDAVLECGSTYYRDMLRSGRLARGAMELYRHWRHVGTFRGAGLRSMLSSVKMHRKFPFPGWLDASFVKRQQLEERWRQLWETYHKYDTADQLQRPWTGVGVMGYEFLQMPLEARFPFMDIRLVKFSMGLPNYIKFDKFILREIMSSNLPESVRTRPKEGVPGDMVRKKIENGMLDIEVNSVANLSDCGYVNYSEYKKLFDDYRVNGGIDSTFTSEFIIQPLALGGWFENGRS